jgi:hypothetical protein
VIEAAFFGLLMATIGDAMFSAAGEFATEFATVGLLLVTAWADEEHIATARRETKALPKGSLMIIRHVDTGQDGQPRPKVGKCGLTRTCASETEHPRKNPGCLRSRGFIFCSVYLRQRSAKKAEKIARSHIRAACRVELRWRRNFVYPEGGAKLYFTLQPRRREFEK